MTHLPFNRPPFVGTEAAFIREAIESGQLSAGGPFSQRCQEWLEERTGARKALLTHSATAALEMAAILLELGPGDEVLMPSFTFVSTANAFVLRGATPVFVDIRPDTLNMDESQLEAAITPATRAVVPVHYAAVGCEMDAICELASRHGLAVVEDAAQALMASLGGRPLGALGKLGAISFHETKNVTCGEGGALLINDESLIERAEVIREKGTDRSRFFRGEVDKYTWVDIGSSYALGDLNAAFLWAQLAEVETITRGRIAIWERYHEGFAELEAAGMVRRPVIPPEAEHNAHMYYLLTADAEARTRLIAALAERDINAVFHFIPLHSSEAGRRFGRVHGELTNTDELSERLVRLPIWTGMESAQVDAVVEAVGHALA